MYLPPMCTHISWRSDPFGNADYLVPEAGGVAARCDGDGDGDGAQRSAVMKEGVEEPMNSVRTRKLYAVGTPAIPDVVRGRPRPRSSPHFVTWT